MTIREAKQTDIPRIVDLGSRSLQEGPYKEHLADNQGVTRALAARLLKLDNAKVIVADDNGKLVGIFAFIVFPHYYSGETVAGEMIWYVVPEARKSSLALELLWKAEELAGQLGAEKMQLTAPTDEIAQMYSRLKGYQRIETAFQRKLRCQLQPA